MSVLSKIVCWKQITTVSDLRIEPQCCQRSFVESKSQLRSQAMSRYLCCQRSFVESKSQPVGAATSLSSKLSKIVCWKQITTDWCCIWIFQLLSKIVCWKQITTENTWFPTLPRCQRSFVESKSQQELVQTRTFLCCQRSFVESKSQQELVQTRTFLCCQRSFVESKSQL